ncbi:calcium-binding protein [Ensifer sp. ENS07]|uniref:calcium-binding protein n=1 Tax=Ensifer sp. ENS07 TaxID=2769274 RepID=UPI001782322C|nr:calcium-binding protein [Ensifer sp. ENS07]MBD9641054.1 calcium-binding protein [Ensifer sp. ENS07]
MPTIKGNNSNNKLIGDSDVFGVTNYIYGYGGNDVLTGGFHADNYIWGGSGNDIIDGGTRINRLHGEEGDDTITVSWSDTDSQIYGGAGNDNLTGGDGGVFFDGGTGVDVMDGGAGADVYMVDNTLDQIIEDWFPPYDNIVNPTDIVRTSTSYALSSAARIELFETANAAGAIALNLTGNGFSQKIKGNAGANILDGRAGNDVLIGGAGNDALIGGDGSDTLLGEAGGDRIDGGVGIDTASYSSASVGITASLLTPSRNTNDAKGDTYLSVENLIGSRYNDLLYGNSEKNLLRAESGNDYIDGGLGADTMNGGGGNDTYIVNEIGDIIDEVSQSGSGTDTVKSSISFSLVASAKLTGAVENLTLLGAGNTNATGNSLANILVGNSGNNILNGSAGKDKLAGGLGNDTFFFNSALSATTNVDTVTDFDVAADTIRLENAIFTAITGTGKLTADQFVKNTAGLAADTSDRIIYETDTGKLFYDSDGSAAGGSVHFATIGVNLAVTLSDFFIV